jgi:hypothetical protein
LRFAHKPITHLPQFVNPHQFKRGRGHGARDKNRTGRGTRDGGRNWEGEAPAEPKTAANGDWQLATGKTAASSEWRVANSRVVRFLEGSALALPKNFLRIRRCALQFFRLLQQASFS